MSNVIGTNDIGTNNIGNKINVLYSKAGYMDKYGSDVWAAAIICLLFIVFINYYYFVNVIEVIKADWTHNRCNPLVLPFAGFIKKPTDVSNLEFTASNFNNCINEILKSVVLVAVQPLYFAVNVIQEAVNNLVDAVNRLRNLTANMRDQFSSIVNQIYAGLSNLVVTFINYTIKIKDSILKINGILSTSIYTLFGSYMALTSLFLCILDLIIIILIAIAVVCLCFLILSMIPLIGSAFRVSWGVTAGIMLLIMIPVIWFEIMLLRIMDLSTPPPPGIPGCFAGETLVELVATSETQSSTKKIQEIDVGDKLKNGSIVTSTIKFAADEQNIYKLRGTFVTGEHRVFHPTLKWIKVKNHPESVYVPDYNEPFVYCLNTDHKTFTIGETLYSDWDDIDKDVLKDLYKYCVSPGYLPVNFTLADIHTYLDSGFCEDSTVILQNGETVPINKVKVNDTLSSGEKIVGVIKIKADDLAIYNYSFNKGDDIKKISGTRNIHINDPTIGVICGMHIKNKTPASYLEPYLYHFLTDTKCVTINNIRFNDYNSGIDKYLRQYNM